MDCSEFRRYLCEYAEGSLLLSKKEEFHEHMHCCDGCRAEYERENFADRLLTEHFSLKDISFTSSRTEIIKNIDKKLYGQSFLNKIHFHFKRKEKIYAVYAAALLIFFMITPYVRSNISGLFKHTNKENAVLDKQISNKKSSFSAPESAGSVLKDNVKFVVEELDNNTAFPINSSWRRFSNLEICLDNLNRILVYDFKTTNKRRISLSKTAKNSVIKYLEWRDEANILVIVGSSGAQSSMGGDVYNVQAYKGISYLFYKCEDKNQEVIRVTKTSENSFLLELADYSNSSRNSFTTIKKQVIIDESGMIKSESIVK